MDRVSFTESTFLANESDENLEVNISVTRSFGTARDVIVSIMTMDVCAQGMHINVTCIYVYSVVTIFLQLTLITTPFIWRFISILMKISS